MSGSQLYSAATNRRIRPIFRLPGKRSGSQSTNCARPCMRARRCAACCSNSP
jgi:hypothetical protein